MGYAVTKPRNASEAALALCQAEFPGYHPLIALTRLAHDTNVRQDPRLEMEIHKTILPYVAPKLSSVEVKNVQEDDRRVIVSLFEQKTLEDGRVVDVEVPLVTEVEDLVPLD